MTLPYLEQDAEAGDDQDIYVAGGLACGSYTAARDGRYICSFSLSSLANTAATITARLLHTTSGDAEIRTFKYAEAKDAATDTTYGAEFDPVLVHSGEKLVLYLESSNSGDTTVSYITDWADAFAVDAVMVSGDATAADNLETMLDGTGGQALTLGQLVINSSAAGGAVDIDNSNGAGIEIDGTTYGITCVASAGPGIDIRGTIYGVYCTASSGVGFYVLGATAGMEVGATGSGASGFTATGGPGASHGIYAIANGTGEGIYALGGATSGPGIKAEARGGNDAGMELVKHGTGKDIDADEIDNILADTGTDGVVVAAASKTGYKLASDGLDTVATTEPTGVATTYAGMMVQLWRRFFKKSTLTTTELKTYKNDGSTVVTTQSVSDDDTTQTQGTAS